jgi:hypothetical protein
MELQVSAAPLEQLLAAAELPLVHSVPAVLLPELLRASLPALAAQVSPEVSALQLPCLAALPGSPSAHRPVWRCGKDRSWA